MPNEPLKSVFAIHLDELYSRIAELKVLLRHKAYFQAAEEINRIAEEVNGIEERLGEIQESIKGKLTIEERKKVGWEEKQESYMSWAFLVVAFVLVMFLFRFCASPAEEALQRSQKHVVDSPQGSR